MKEFTIAELIDNDYTMFTNRVLMYLDNRYAFVKRFSTMDKIQELKNLHDAIQLVAECGGVI